MDNNIVYNDLVLKKNCNDFFKHILIILDMSLDKRLRDYGYRQYDAKNKLSENMRGKPFTSRRFPDKRTTRCCQAYNTRLGFSLHGSYKRS